MALNLLCLIQRSLVTYGYLHFNLIKFKSNLSFKIHFLSQANHISSARIRACVEPSIISDELFLRSLWFLQAPKYHIICPLSLFFSS